MKASGYNKILEQKRLDLGLSLKEASSKLKIPSLVLYLYEKGYLIVFKRHYQRFIDVYSLEQNFFEDSLLYPDSGEVKEKENAFVSLSRKLWFRLASVALLCGAIPLIVLGNNQIDYSNNNVLSFYSIEAVAFRETVIEYGTKEETYFDTTYVYDKEYENTETNRKYLVSSIVYEEKEQFKFTLMSMTVSAIDKKEAFDEIDVAIQNTYEGVMLNVVEENFFDTTFLIKEGKYYVQSIKDFQGKEYTDQDYEYYLYAGLALSDIQTHSEYMNLAIRELSGSTTITLPVFFGSIEQGNNNYTASFGGGVTMLFFGGVFVTFAVFFVIFIAWIIVIDYKHEKLRLLVDLDLVDVDLEAKASSKKKELKKNIKFPFIVPETLLRIGVIVLILFASLSAYAFFSYFLGLVGIGKSTKLEVDKIQTLLNLYRFTSNFICIATLLHMFIKIDIFIETKSYIRNAIQMFLAGCIFYVSENLLVYGALSGFNNLADVTSLLVDYLPGNIFWGMGVYALFAMFLFTKPKIFEGRKKLNIVWHSCAVIPLLYLIISMVYSVMVKTKSWERIPYYFAFLLYPKGLILSLFIICFCVGVFIYRYITVKKYGQEDAEIVFKGNYYVLFKNITAAVLVLILGLIDLTIHYTVPTNNVYTNALNLGKNYYILVIIPFVLLYRPHIGPRKAKLDLTYSVLYGLSCSIGYILLTILILPYLSYLEPILAMLLK